MCDKLFNYTRIFNWCTLFTAYLLNFNVQTCYYNKILISSFIIHTENKLQYNINKLCNFIINILLVQQ